MSAQRSCGTPSMTAIASIAVEGRAKWYATARASCAASTAPVPSSGGERAARTTGGTSPHASRSAAAHGGAAHAQEWSHRVWPAHRSEGGEQTEAASVAATASSRPWLDHNPSPAAARPTGPLHQLAHRRRRRPRPGRKRIAQGGDDQRQGEADAADDERPHDDGLLEEGREGGVGGAGRRRCAPAQAPPPRVRHGVETLGWRRAPGASSAAARRSWRPVAPREWV